MKHIILLSMTVSCALVDNMDASRVIGAAFVTLCVVLLSNQMQAANDTDASTIFLCPLMDFPEIVNKTMVHNITRTVKCVNGREMAGCCVPRLYCDFNTSNIDLTLYGPPGYRIPCSDICCPQNYILPIPLPKDDGSTNAQARDNNSDNSSDSDDED